MDPNLSASQFGLSGSLGSSGTPSPIGAGASSNGVNGAGQTSQQLGMGSSNTASMYSGNGGVG